MTKTKRPERTPKPRKRAPNRRRRESGLPPPNVLRIDCYVEGETTIDEAWEMYLSIKQMKPRTRALQLAHIARAWEAADAPRPPEVAGEINGTS